ncbi:MAG: hypothetical protein KDI50_04640 [Candidatus Competibacteraceae bacterium]|nr:hypothetical protein [Candidatus Competibacteraceae bacterium]
MPTDLTAIIAHLDVALSATRAALDTLSGDENAHDDNYALAAVVIRLQECISTLSVEEMRAQQSQGALRTIALERRRRFILWLESGAKEILGLNDAQLMRIFNTEKGPSFNKLNWLESCGHHSRYALPDGLSSLWICDECHQLHDPEDDDCPQCCSSKAPQPASGAEEMRLVS